MAEPRFGAVNRGSVDAASRQPAAACWRRSRLPAGEPVRGRAAHRRRWMRTLIRSPNVRGRGGARMGPCRGNFVGRINEVRSEPPAPRARASREPGALGVRRSLSVARSATSFTSPPSIGHCPRGRVTVVAEGAGAVRAGDMNGGPDPDRRSCVDGQTRQRRPPGNHVRARRARTGTGRRQTIEGSSSNGCCTMTRPSTCRMVGSIRRASTSPSRAAAHALPASGNRARASRLRRVGKMTVA